MRVVGDARRASRCSPRPGHASHHVCYFDGDGRSTRATRPASGSSRVALGPAADAAAGRRRGGLVPDDRGDRAPRARAAGADPLRRRRTTSPGTSAELRERLDTWAQRVESGASEEEFVRRGEASTCRRRRRTGYEPRDAVLAVVRRASGGTGRRVRRSGIAPLREREFRLLFPGRTVSLVGSAIAPVALAFAVLDLTGSKTDLGLVLAAREIPLIVFLLAGGIWADRLPRNLVMVGANLAQRARRRAPPPRCCITGLGRDLAPRRARGGERRRDRVLLPGLAGDDPADRAGADPAAGERAALARDERGDDRRRARSAGFLVAAFGPGWAIAIDACTFLAGAAFVAAMRLPAVAPGESRELPRDLATGWREFRRRLAVGDRAPVLVPAHGLRRRLHRARPGRRGRGAGRAEGVGRDPAGQAAGCSSAACSASAPAAAHAAGRDARDPAAAAPLVALGFPLRCPVLVAAAFVAGVGSEVFGVLWHTTMQQEIPADKLSRVYSYDALGSIALVPVGYALAGPIAARSACRQRSGAPPRSAWPSRWPCSSSTTSARSSARPCAALRPARDEPARGRRSARHQREPDDDQRRRAPPRRRRCPSRRRAPARATPRRRRRRATIDQARYGPSLAPIRIPSSAKTAPFSGCIRANRNQTACVRSTTSSSLVNAYGSTPSSASSTSREHGARRRPRARSSARSPRRRVGVAGAEAAADDHLAGDRDRVEHEREEDPELERDLVRGDRGVAEAGDDRAGER